MDLAEAPWAETAFVRVPEGHFLMGSGQNDPLAWEDERPQHTVSIDYGYWIGRTPVTNEQFGRFTGATGYTSSAEREGWAFVFDVANERWERVPGADWRHPTGPTGNGDGLQHHPVVAVSWHDARAYCEWMNQAHEADLPEGLRFRLPSEAEWEKAARGPFGRIFPWGDRFEPEYCNHIGSAALTTIAVDTLPPESESPYGVVGMSGNTWDWTATLWGADRNEPRFTYPYDPADGREDPTADDEVLRIVRGGSFKNDPQACRSACRDLDPPGWSLNNLGFRVVVATSLPPAGTQTA